jgi:hypothetical protein
MDALKSASILYGAIRYIPSTKPILQTTYFSATWIVTV